MLTDREILYTGWTVFFLYCGRFIIWSEIIFKNPPGIPERICCLLIIDYLFTYYPNWFPSNCLSLKHLLSNFLNACLPCSFPNPLQSFNVSSVQSHEAVRSEIVHSTLIATAIKHAVASLVGQDKQIWWLSRPWPCITEPRQEASSGRRRRIIEREKLQGREHQTLFVMRFSISRLKHVERGIIFMRKCETQLACFVLLLFSFFLLLVFCIWPVEFFVSNIQQI